MAGRDTDARPALLRGSAPATSVEPAAQFGLAPRVLVDGLLSKPPDAGIVAVAEHDARGVDGSLMVLDHHHGPVAGGIAVMHGHHALVHAHHRLHVFPTGRAAHHRRVHTAVVHARHGLRALRLAVTLVPWLGEGCGGEGCDGGGGEECGETHRVTFPVA